MGTKEQRNAELKAINTFMFYSWNFQQVPYDILCHDGSVRHEHVPTFLMEVDWSCNRDHMASKWFKIVSKHESWSYIPAFYSELDGENRKRMLNWILSNYHQDSGIDL